MATTTDMPVTAAESVSCLDPGASSTVGIIKIANTWNGARASLRAAAHLCAALILPSINYFDCIWILLCHCFDKLLTASKNENHKNSCIKNRLQLALSVRCTVCCAALVIDWYECQLLRHMLPQPISQRGIITVSYAWYILLTMHSSESYDCSCHTCVHVDAGCSTQHSEHILISSAPVCKL
jgi:hypothetical protein